MLSYMLPREEEKGRDGQRQQQHPAQSFVSLNGSTSGRYPGGATAMTTTTTTTTRAVTRTTSHNAMFGGRQQRGGDDEIGRSPRPGSAAPLLPPVAANHDQVSPKHAAGRKSTLHSHSHHAAGSKVTKDDSLYSIDSDAASTGGSERKNKPINGPPAKHANLKRVSFGSSKGSMVETLVYETPVQEEPEINHFGEHNGRLPVGPIIPVPDTDEGREKVRVSFKGPTPFPSTPGVLLLEPIGPTVDIMAASAAELLTAHTDHTVPTYHTQISTDSGWDNPFRPDGDLSREADEIVELIKGGKPITPTPGQNAPALPGCERKSASELDAAAPNRHQGNGNAHSTPNKPSSNQQSANEKSVGQVEVGRSTAQAPGDVSQVEHVTLKKKPKCKCCVLQ